MRWKRARAIIAVMERQVGGERVGVLPALLSV